MREFHGERERSIEVQKNLARSFDLAEAMFNFWLTQPKDEWIAKSALATQVVNLAMILDVQACRLFRSVIEECRRCEGFNASILARTLFETVLAQRFLLAKRLRIVVEPVLVGGKPKVTAAGIGVFCAKAPYKSMIPNPKHWLSRELRANLYLAHGYFQTEQSIDRMGKFPDGKRRVESLKKRAEPSAAASYEAEIGPEWSYILRNRPHTYSGLSVAELAKVLHKQLHRWYETIYHFQSRAVHANDLLKHLDISEGDTLKAIYLSSDGEVYQSLRTAITMFLININLLHQNVGFGTDVDIAYCSFTRKFHRLSMEGK